MSGREKSFKETEDENAYATINLATKELFLNLDGIYLIEDCLTERGIEKITITKDTELNVGSIDTFLNELGGDKGTEIYCLFCNYESLEGVFDDKYKLVDCFRESTKSLLYDEDFIGFCNKTDDEIFEMLDIGYDGFYVVTKYLNNHKNN